MASKLKVTLVRSGINRKEAHKRTVQSLGLRRLHQSVVVPDNLAVRGMIKSVAHLVRVEPAE